MYLASPEELGQRVPGDAGRGGRGGPRGMEGGEPPGGAVGGAPAPPAGSFSSGGLAGGSGGPAPAGGPPPAAGLEGDAGEDRRGEDRRGEDGGESGGGVGGGGGAESGGEGEPGAGGGGGEIGGGNSEGQFSGPPADPELLEEAFTPETSEMTEASVPARVPAPDGQNVLEGGEAERSAKEGGAAPAEELEGAQVVGEEDEATGATASEAMREAYEGPELEEMPKSELEPSAVGASMEGTTGDGAASEGEGGQHLEASAALEAGFDPEAESREGMGTGMEDEPVPDLELNSNANDLDNAAGKVAITAEESADSDVEIFLQDLVEDVAKEVENESAQSATNYPETEEKESNTLAEEKPGLDLAKEVPEAAAQTSSTENPVSAADAEGAAEVPAAEEAAKAAAAEEAAGAAAAEEAARLAAASEADQAAQKAADADAAKLAATEAYLLSPRIAQAEATRITAEAEAARITAEAEAVRLAAEAAAMKIKAEAEATRVTAEAESNLVRSQAILAQTEARLAQATPSFAARAPYEHRAASAVDAGMRITQPEVTPRSAQLPTDDEVLQDANANGADEGMACTGAPPAERMTISEIAVKELEAVEEPVCLQGLSFQAATSAQEKLTFGGKPWPGNISDSNSVPSARLIAEAQDAPARAEEDLQERAAFYVRRSERSLKEAISQAERGELQDFAEDPWLVAQDREEPLPGFSPTSTGAAQEQSTVNSELIKQTKNLNRILSESVQLETGLQIREEEMKREATFCLPQKLSPPDRSTDGQGSDPGPGALKRPPLPKLPLENLSPFGLSGFSQPLDSLDSSTCFSEGDTLAAPPPAPSTATKTEGPPDEKPPKETEASSAAALRARLMQSFETEGKLRIQVEMGAADLECARRERAKAVRNAEKSERRAVDAESTLKDYLATPAEAKAKRLEKQVAKFMEDNSRLRLQVQALQEENQRHASLYQRSEKALKALQEKERAQARALLRAQESARPATAAPEAAKAWSSPTQAPLSANSMDDLRAQVMELKGALNQATNTNSSLLKSSSEYKKALHVGEDVHPTIHSMSQIEERLANIENNAGRHTSVGVAGRVSAGWQAQAQTPSQNIQGWNNLAPYPQMNPAPVSSPSQFRGGDAAGRQRLRPQSARGGIIMPRENGGQSNYRPRFQHAQAHFHDRTVRSEYVDVPPADGRMRPRHGSAGPHRGGGGGAPGRALAPTYSAFTQDGFAVPPSKMSEEALANARAEYAAECRRIKEMLSVKLEEVPL